MTKRFFLTVLIALLFGATAAADPALNGRWFSDEWGEVFVFDNGNWELWAGEYPEMRGTYTVENGTIIFTGTHLGGNGLHYLGLDGIDAQGWYSIDELFQMLVEEIDEMFGSLLYELLAEDLLDEFIAEIFSEQEEIQEEGAEMLAAMDETERAVYQRAVERFSEVMLAQLDAVLEFTELPQALRAATIFMAEMMAFEFWGISMRFAEDIAPFSGTYSISGDTLTITIAGNPVEFTRR